MEYPLSFSQVTISPNQERAKFTIIFFRVILVVNLLALVLNISTFRSVNDMGDVSKTALFVNGLFGLFSFFPYAVLGIFFLLWMSRAYQNLYRSDVGKLEFSSGWAVGAWFIPLANLFMPCSLMDEIWNKTQLAYRKEQPFEKKKSTLVFYWWFAYIFAGIVAVIASMQLRQKHWELGYLIAIFSNMITLLAITYGTKMVRTIAAMEKEMQERAEEEYAVQLSETARQFVEGGTAFNPPVQNKTEGYKLTEAFVDNSERSKFLVIGLKALIGFAFLFGLLCIYIISESKPENYFETLKAADKWLGKINMLGFGTFCITGIIAALWMKRAYSNLHRLSIQGLFFKPNAAIYSWFIPIGNFFMPYSILQDINRNTQEAIAQKKFVRGILPDNYRLIIFLWIFFIISGLFLFGTFFFMRLPVYDLFYIAARMTAARFGIIAAVAGIITLYLGTIAVKNISALEAELYKKVEEYQLVDETNKEQRTEENNSETI
jgi:hypothetical protein